MNFSENITELPNRLYTALLATALLSGAVFIGTLAACGFTTYVPGFVSPYRYDVQQGNFITKEMVAQLKLGLTRDQVRFALGTPLITDAFHADRWDYVFRLQKADGKIEFNRYVVVFKDNVLDRFGGSSDLPTEIDAVTTQTNTANAPDLITGTANAPELPTEPSSAVTGPSTESTPQPIESESTPEATQNKPVIGQGTILITKPNANPEPSVNASPANNVNPNAKVAATLTAWVAAWSKQDIRTYLRFYAPNFKHGMQSRAAWESFRRRRLSNPNSIQITIANQKVALRENNQAEVRFEQRYKSNTFNETGHKTLELIMVNGEWKILKETFFAAKH